MPCEVFDETDAVDVDVEVNVGPKILMLETLVDVDGSFSPCPLVQQVWL